MAVVWFGVFSLHRYTLYCFTLSEFKVELKICWKRYTGWGGGNNFPVTYYLFLPFSLITMSRCRKMKRRAQKCRGRVCSWTPRLKATYSSEVTMPTSGQIPHREEHKAIPAKKKIVKIYVNHNSFCANLTSQLGKRLYVLTLFNRTFQLGT